MSMLNTVEMKLADTPPRKLAYGVGFSWFDHLATGGHYARSRRYPLSVDKPVVPDLNDRAGWEAMSILMVNDHPTENHRVKLKLPREVARPTWDCQLTDRVQLGKTCDAVTADAQGILQIDATAYGLTVLSS